MSSLENKTIRPGSFKGYAFYHSNRLPPAAPPPTVKAHHRRGLVLLAVVLIVGSFGYGLKDNDEKPSASQAATVISLPETSASKTLTADHCATNTEAKLIKVSIDKRHLWACEGSRTVRDAAIITGLRNHPETETPPGTYHVYAKQQDTTLSGSDSRGAWKYPVYYWQPFLDNQYGTYGFHDATWRPETDFGNISPDSQEASHGCIELNFADSKWLYEWAEVKTTVLVEA